MDVFNMTKDADGNPVIEECQQRNFFTYYSTREGFTLFRAFYENNFGIQDKYVDYWTQVVQALGKNKYVVGFDPINEPYPS